VFALIELSLLLAEDAQAPGDPNALPRLMMLVVGFGALMYFLMIRPQKKREDEFRNLVSQLKENDHVVTAGGIHGVVTNVQRDNDRVTIRVDESTGTKLRVTMSSISRVITDEGDQASAGDGKTK
jgi:preprotein translocase subunit YajC